MQLKRVSFHVEGQSVSLWSIKGKIYARVSIRSQVAFEKNKNFFAQISKTIKVSVDELNIDISSGDVEVSFVQSLIKEGVQVNRQDDDGKTALQIASQHGNVTALNDTNVQIF